MGKFKFKILLQGIDAQIIMNLTESAVWMCMMYGNFPNQVNVC